MADTGEARNAARDAVVRPLSRAAVRPCSRPGCPSPARATLSFRYGTREAWIESLAEEASPATYDLCSGHADRTRPPSGWALQDHRPADDVAAATPAAPAHDLGGEHTVAVLAAALRAVPGPGATAEPPAAPVAAGDAPVTEVVEQLAGIELEDLDVDDLDLPDGLADDVRDALAELAAVARRDHDAEQIAIELDDERPAAPTPAAPVAAPTPTPAAPAPAPTPAPRPVRAARERAGEDGAAPGGPARAW